MLDLCMSGGTYSLARDFGKKNFMTVFFILRAFARNLEKNSRRSRRGLVGCESTFALGCWGSSTVSSGYIKKRYFLEDF